ncbi:probable cytochrome P450 49a1 [Uloborus diversus]|uniref:probable cytochrome P450 49a1 n=1 Tax=Uloborus diversus TaxID=327109 RepID=UPI00240924FB|nr:probable cytochrome P450 49a1 [Uloborus diversus]
MFASYSRFLRSFRDAKKIVSSTSFYRQETTVASEKSECNIKSFDSIPGPRRLPLIGHLHLFSKFGPYSFDKLYDAYEDLYKLYGPIVRLDVGISLVLLFRPEDIQQVLALDGRYPQRPIFEALRFYRSKKKDTYSSAGLVGENGHEWRRLREAINFMMRPHFAQLYLPAQTEIAQDFVNRIKLVKDADGHIPDFLQEIYRFTEEAIGFVCFGTRLGLLNQALTDNSAQLSKAADDTMQALADTLLGFPWWKIFNTPTYKKLAQSQDFFHNFASKCAKEAAERIKHHNSDDVSLEFFKRLFTENKLNSKDVSLLMTEIFSAGIDATGNAIGFLLYDLAQNPEVQQKLFEEIERYAPCGQEKMQDTVENMKYLNACIKESYRLHPTSGGTARILNEETVLSGYYIPKNTLCVGPHPIISRLPEHFTDPLKFKPERWVDEHSRRIGNVAHPYCVLPFTHGVRRCVGQRFAEQEIRLCIIKVIQNFEVTYNGPEVGRKMRMLLIPDKPLNFTFTDRLRIK